MGTRRWGLDNPELVPSRLKDYLKAKAPFIDFLVAFVCELAVGDPRLETRMTRMGAPSYDRRMLLAVWLYGLRLGITSSRKLEEACLYRMDFMYLTGREQPDHSTLWGFFNEYGPELKGVLKRMIGILRSLSLVQGNSVLIDGTTMSSKGSRHKIRRVKDLEKTLKELESQVGSALERASEGEAEEELEAPESDSREALREQIRAALAADSKRDELPAERVCTSDPESIVLRYKDYGSGPGYNVQVGADAETGMILSVEATTDKSDTHQLVRQTRNAAEMLGAQPRVVVADAGYHVADELAEAEALGVEVFCPEKKKANDEPDNPFSAQHFVYDETRKTLICPAGKELKLQMVKSEPAGRNRTTSFELFRAGVQCRKCPHFGQCTKSPSGRQVKRVLNQGASKRTIERNGTERGQIELGRRRRIEHRFAEIKQQMGIRRVLASGIQKTTHFLTLVAMASNLGRAFRCLEGRGVDPKTYLKTVGRPTTQRPRTKPSQLGRPGPLGRLFTTLLAAFGHIPHRQGTVRQTWLSCPSDHLLLASVGQS